MAKTLSSKKRKSRRDMAKAYAKNPVPQSHKVARTRSTRAKARKAYPMA